MIEKPTKRIRSFTNSVAILIGLLGLVVSINASVPSAAPGASSAELAGARAATAKYHEVSRAEADGYVNIDFCEPGEGCHWAKFSLIDGNFDPEQPEFLLYTPNGANGDMRLIAVEYVVPLGLSTSAPQGFTGNADTWRQDTEEAGLWELTVWLWYHNPNGLFEQYNPRLF